MSEVAVIGGSGFIGRALVAKLDSGGAAVRVVSRGAGGPPQKNIRYVRASVSDAPAMRRALAGVTEAFYLATGGGDRWEDFERDYVGAAGLVGRLCLELGVRRLIYTSSIAALYLGEPGVADDSTPADPRDEARSYYARAKARAERVLMELHRKESLPVVILRPGVVVGRGGVLTHSGLGYWPVDTWCLGWGRGRNPLPFVLVQDVASALAAARCAPGIEGRAFNLAGDVFVSASEFVKELAIRSRRKIRFYPQSLLKIQAVEIAKWVIKALARKPENPFPSFRDLKSRGLFTQLDCSGAKTLLGWQPNADPEVFFREAIDMNLRPIPEDDPRKPPLRC
jgi:nucleoside-diphosphate-sugar epimerase